MLEYAYVWLGLGAAALVGLGSWHLRRSRSGSRAEGGVPRALGIAAVAVGGCCLFFIALPIVAYTLLALAQTFGLID